MKHLLHPVQFRAGSIDERQCTSIDTVIDILGHHSLGLVVMPDQKQVEEDMLSDISLPGLVSGS